MNTKIMKQFNTLNADTLEAIEGGGEIGASNVITAMGSCLVFGAAVGTFILPVVGSVAGAVLTGPICMGGYALAISK